LAFPLAGVPVVVVGVDALHRLKVSSHSFWVRFLPGKEPKCANRLKDRHAPAAHGAAPKGASCPKKFCFEREVNDIGYPQVRTEEPCWQRHARMFGHANRCRIDQAIGPGHRFIEISRERSGSPSTEPCAELIGEPLCSVDIGVDDDDFLNAKGQQGMGHRSACPAGAELYHVVTWSIGQFTLEAFSKPPPIRIMANGPTIPEHDSIDRAQRLCVRAQLIEEGNDCLLAGISDIQAGKAHALCRRNEIGQSFRSKPEFIQINQLVYITKALLRTLALVKSRRA
jgi:hypothetical protein